jgi:endo-1,4-beta-D-glucanase Y
MKPFWIRAASVACLMVLASANAHCAPQTIWPFWDAYRTHFITADGRIVDWSAEERTTSEGEAYALFFALVANDRVSFDLILNWTQDHLAKGSLQENLPSWLWKRSADGKWGVADSNPASDADLWIAYTTIQAGRLWHEDSYANLGRRMAQRIATEEVVQIPGNQFLLLPGPTGFNPIKDVYFANPSYAPLQLLAALGAEFPGGPWRELMDGVPKQLSANVGHGFAMDWVRLQTDSGYSGVAGPSTPGPGFGSYDAIRVYLWAGLAASADPLSKPWLAALGGMRQAVTQSGYPPERVNVATGVTSGEGPLSYWAALAPYFKTLGDDRSLGLARTHLAALDAPAAAPSATAAEPPNPSREPVYYDRVLGLFGAGFIEGRYRFDEAGRLVPSWRSAC